MGCDEEAFMAKQSALDLENKIKMMNTNNTVSFALIDTLLCDDDMELDRLAKRTTRYNDALKEINTRNGMQSPSFYGWNKYIRTGKTIRRREMNQSTILRMGRQVESHFAQLYGIPNLVSTRKILTVAEERQRMADKALERLGRKSAALMQDVATSEESEEASGESEKE